MMTIIEIAVYAVVLSGGSTLSCMGFDHERVNCTNGLSAEMVSQAIVRFSDGTLVDRDQNGFPRFSNGITSWFASAGCLTFSNGLEVRRITPDTFRFNQGIECHVDMPNLVRCSRPQR